MNIAIKYLPRYTIKDYEKWEGNWELIEGIVYALSSPLFKHRRVAGKLFRFLDEALEKSCKNCVVGIDTDYVIDEHTVVRPDVFVTCDKVENKLLKAPQIIFEIVSETTSDRDEGLKKELYERENVKYYVLVYPELKKARIFKLINGKYQKVFKATEDKYIFEIRNCKFPLDFSKVWS